MKNILVDTNIVLDLLAKRHPFYEYSAGLFSLADIGKTNLYVSAITILNTHYILSGSMTKARAKEILRKIKILVKILPCNEKIIELGLNSDFNDFEDAVQYFTAIQNKLNAIITRNTKDFKQSEIPVLTAEEYIKGYII